MTSVHLICSLPTPLQPKILGTPMTLALLLGNDSDQNVFDSLIFIDIVWLRYNMPFFFQPRSALLTRSNPLVRSETAQCHRLIVALP